MPQFTRRFRMRVLVQTQITIEVDANTLDEAHTRAQQGAWHSASTVNVDECELVNFITCTDITKENKL